MTVLGVDGPRFTSGQALQRREQRDVAADSRLARVCEVRRLEGDGGNRTYGSFESAPYKHDFKLSEGDKRKAKLDVLQPWPGP
jgi:predicted secreted acid phosphatase